MFQKCSERFGGSHFTVFDSLTPINNAACSNFSAKAIYDNKLLECYFTRSFYKHILGILVKYTDMESEDYSFYQGLVYLMEHHVSDLGYDLTFSAEVSRGSES
jgi:hypothetical protein